MQFNVNAPNPSALLRGTLKVLAENFGGYKDGSDFLELFDDLISGDDAELTRLGALELRKLVHNVEGATSAYQLQDAQEATFVQDEPEDPHAAEDADITFLAPTEADRIAMFGGPIEGPVVFRLVGGPEALFTGSPVTLDQMAARFPDFGIEGDIISALHGSPQTAPDETVEDVLKTLDPIEQLTLIIGLGPQLFTMPVGDVKEHVAEMRAAIARQAARMAA